MLESAVFSLQEKKQKKVEVIEADVAKANAVAEEIVSYAEQKKDYISEKIAIEVELERLKSWGDIDPRSMDELAKKGICVSLFVVLSDSKSKSNKDGEAGNSSLVSGVVSEQHSNEIVDGDK
jgi:hypothetical protein